MRKREIDIRKMIIRERNKNHERKKKEKRKKESEIIERKENKLIK
jgi:hypothetical protein